jgi:hypothetical protein
MDRVAGGTDASVSAARDMVVDGGDFVYFCSVRRD